jgi:hypothetical protein
MPSEIQDIENIKRVQELVGAHTLEKKPKVREDFFERRNEFKQFVKEHSERLDRMREIARQQGNIVIDNFFCHSSRI